MTLTTTLGKEDLPAPGGGSPGVSQDSGSGALGSGLEGGEGSTEGSTEGSAEGEDDFLVDWDGLDDPANPINWPARSRWAHIMMISFLGLVTYVSRRSLPPISLLIFRSIR